MRLVRRILPILAMALAFACFAAVEPAIAPEELAPTCYTFAFSDIDGNPVEGVIVIVCGESFCAPVVSDAEGIAVFEGAPFAYDVHILSVPEGFVFDASLGYLTEETYGRMEFVLERTELLK